MKRLPGPQSASVLQQLLGLGVFVIATIWMITLIPLLLVVD